MLDTPQAEQIIRFVHVMQDATKSRSEIYVSVFCSICTITFKGGRPPGADTY